MVNNSTNINWTTTYHINSLNIKKDHDMMLEIEVLTFHKNVNGLNWLLYLPGVIWYFEPILWVKWKLIFWVPWSANKEFFAIFATMYKCK